MKKYRVLVPESWGQKVMIIEANNVKDAIKKAVERRYRTMGAETTSITRSSTRKPAIQKHGRSSLRRLRSRQSFLIDGDRVEALYNEEPDLDVRRIGRIVRARKISDVRFDSGRQVWIAVDRKSGKVIARDPSRKECVRKEHLYYEKEIARGRIPWR